MDRVPAPHYPPRCSDAEGGYGASVSSLHITSDDLAEYLLIRLQVAHGDIKSENVLITTDLTVQLTDFSSSFKPTYLPLDDPSDFSFFFDTSSRRTCYLAPERFFASDSSLAEEKRAAAAAHREASDTERASAWAKRDGKVTEGMDVFSAGCVLAEMWTDGRTVFNLSELFAYRDGSLGLEGLLDNIDDVHVKVS
jgi:phosphoinositide-3-kinase regulatory subunit 4